MKLKKVYMLFSFIFSILTIYEVVVYLIGYSNYFGLYYIIVNLIILFMLIMVSVNVRNTNSKNRLVKNMVIIILGFISCFLLEYILSSVYSYSDQSKSYIKSIFISIRVLKPMVYVLLGGLSYLEYKNMKI